MADVMRNYGNIAKDYGYMVSVIDLRNPTRSNGNNILYLVNKYTDLYAKHPDQIVYKAKAEKYAKIISKTIILSGIDAASFGQNAYFYDAAEGLLTATILLVAEFCAPEKRHIVSVFKVIQELLAPSKKKGKNQFQQLMELLPNEHKAKWFAGAALNTAEQSMASVMSTALSRLNAFLNTELEQLLCFDTEIDAETFCNRKSAIFVIMPEENPNTFFMISLIIQQLYREILAVADENGGKLKNRCVFFCDEFGTLPKIESAEMMFSASRSRRLQIVPIIQSFAQLEKNYGKEGAEIIVDNTQDTIFGGFAPNSSSAETLSKALGSRTVMSGSVSRSKNDPSQSLQMIERPLLTPDELKSLPKGDFIVMKTGVHPMRVHLMPRALDLRKQGLPSADRDIRCRTADRTRRPSRHGNRRQYHITIYGSIAQSESENISANIKWGKAQAAREGKVVFRYKNFLGYRKGEDGQPEIVPEEAETIRFIYDRFLAGDSLKGIAKLLEEKGIKSPTGKAEWQFSTIQSILSNERYKGDAIINKTYITDCISKKVRVNNGERPKYYVENSHPAIIDSATFGRVQEELARRSGKRKISRKAKTEQGKYSSKYALTELLVCGECKSAYRRCTWTASGKKKIVWRCINRIEYAKKYCHNSPSVEESILQRAVMAAIMETANQNAEILRTLKLHIGIGLAGEKSEDNSIDLQIRIAEIDAEFKKMLDRVSTDTIEAFDEETATRLMNEKSRLQQQLESIADAEQRRENAKSRLDDIYTILDGIKNHPMEYDDQIVRQLLECVVVDSKEQITVIFKGGLKSVQPLNE